MFKTRKFLNLITNVSNTETVEFNITSLEVCDRLDSKYVEMKAHQITNAAETKVETLITELDTKLKKLDKEKAVVIKAATSVSWLAILVTSLFIFIIILNDLYKLFYFLKKNSSSLNGKKEKKFNPQKIVTFNEQEKGNIFKQVMAKDRLSLNHLYFQKRRKMN